MVTKEDMEYRNFLKEMYKKNYYLNDLSVAQIYWNVLLSFDRIVMKITYDNPQMEELRLSVLK